MPTLLKKKGSATKTPSFIDLILGSQSLYQKIAEYAYELFLKRGQDPGHDWNDWLEAKRMVLVEGKFRKMDRS